MAIKKAFTELVSFLEDNADKKVKSILDDVIAMTSAKSGATGGAPMFRKDDDGNVTHVFCYYHQKWEEVAVAEYGTKAGSATGLNNMCKEGVSQWSKQNRAAKAANGDLLSAVSAGTVAVADIGAEQDKINLAKAAIVPRADGHGSD